MKIRKNPKTESRFKPVENIRRLSSYSVSRSPIPIDLYLDGNEGLSPAINEYITELLCDDNLLSKYPNVAGLEKSLAKQLSIEPNQVIVTAGGDEAIDRACRIALCPGRNIILPSPTFSMFEHYARLTGAEIINIDWDSGNFPVDQFINSIDDNTGSVVIVSPNNPTGAVVEKDDIRGIAEAAPQALIIVDLCYEEFADIKLTPVILEYENCIAIRTFSKARGLAGLRVGYALGSPMVIEYLRRAGGPYPVSALSIALAEIALSSYEDHTQRYVEYVKRSRQTLYDCLNKLDANPYQSQGNFILARINNAASISLRLAGMGIAVRTFPNKFDLIDTIRITCPPEDQLDRLIHSFKTVIKPEAILFDLDGVLADVSQSYHQTIIKVAESYGIKITPDKIYECKAEGNTNNDWLLLQSILSENGINPGLSDIIERFEAIYQGDDNNPGLYENERLLVSRSTLDWLRSRFSLGIVTGRPRKDAYRFLSSFGLLKTFDTVVCLEDAELKPSPEPVMRALNDLRVKRACMIGDTPDDIRSARNANALPLGIVAPGMNRESVRTSLFKAGAGGVLDSIDDLKELLA